MNNEPVAWRCNKFYETQEGWFYNENGIGEPLYTHPVKEVAGFFGASEPVYPTVKELTDEEITEIYNQILIHDKKSSFKFARAILRKAQGV